jgi:hypothetical protein
LKSEVDPARIRLLSASNQGLGRALTNRVSIGAGNTDRITPTRVAALDTETVATLPPGPLVPPIINAPV